MEKLDWIKTALLAVAVIVSGYFIGDMHRRAKVYERYVEAKGLSEREVEANLAVWPIEITLAGNELQDLNEKLDGQKKEVKAFFEDMGFDQEEVSIGATNIVDSKAQFYGDGDRNREFRYIAKSEITIRTKEIEKIKKSLAASLDLTSKGIVIGAKNSWRPIEYIYTQLNDIKPEMVEESTKKAKEVAEKFAQDSGSKVGKIKSARQGLFTISDRDPNTPEIKTVRVVSTIEYLLED
ncbi:SIMPL domain-containing protein [Echinicola sediminis]